MARRAIASGRRDRLDPPRSFTRGSDAFLARLVGRSRQIRDGARMLSSFLPPGCRRFGGGAESAPLALGEEPRGAEATARRRRARGGDVARARENTSRGSGERGAGSITHLLSREVVGCAGKVRRIGAERSRNGGRPKKRQAPRPLYAPDFSPRRFSRSTQESTV